MHLGSGLGEEQAHRKESPTMEHRLPRRLVVKNPPANVGDARDTGSVPGLRRSPGVGNGYPLQDSYPGNPMDRGAWQATVHGDVKELDMV